MARVIHENHISVKPYTVGFAKCATCSVDRFSQPLKEITLPNGQRIVLCDDGLFLMLQELKDA